MLRVCLMKRKPEIMAPAGNWTCLTAALHAGADAVYFGLNGLSMRADGCNFPVSAMPRIVKQCRKAGARAYLALNTIIYESELSKVSRTLQAAAKAGVDAVICSDLAVIQKATEVGLPVFLSTQMSVSNSETIAFLNRTFGIRRFVLARECTLEQIRAIRRNLARLPGKPEIDIEVFAHGAMCVSISGRCFLSESSCGKSANRGACTQQCRREYQLIDDEGRASFRLGQNYLLSPEDLCTLPFIEKLIEAGVASLKIEGRARTAEYVSTVTAAYRRVIDFYFRKPKCSPEEFEAFKAAQMKALDTVYHRGLSSGFFMGKPLNQWTNSSGSRATETKRAVGQVMNFYRKAGAADIWVRNTEFSVGDELMIQGPTTGVVKFKVETIQIEHTSVPRAKRGERVAVGVPETVRANDRVYLVTAK